MKKSLILLSLLASFHTFGSENSQLYDYYSNLDQSSDLKSGINRGYVDPSANDDLSLMEKGKALEAKTLGRQTAQYYTEQKIKSLLESQKSQLDKIFNISIYVESYKNNLIIPPIILEINGSKRYLNTEKTSFVYANKTYVIHKQPYFSDHLPTWKDYVVLQTEPPQITSTSLLPKTDEEKKIWKKQFSIGWKLGIKTTIEAFKYQLGRAVFDIQGMQRYGMLRDAKIVSPPIVTENRNRVSGSNTRLDIDSGVIQIKTMPMLQQNVKQWRLIPSLPPINELLPESFYKMIDHLYED